MSKMIYDIASIVDCARVRGTEDRKQKFRIRSNDDDREYCVLYWHGLTNMIVYDALSDEYLAKYNWRKTSSNYIDAVRADELIYMHAAVFYNVFPNERKDGFSIDHINRIPTDNRIANLRLATQSEQNSNRNTRSDKKPPCEELKNAGVVELPKFVRWDVSESKFIIEKHPRLLLDVVEGIRKKPIISGTKSSKLTVTDKFKDILAKLEALSNADGIDFEKKRSILNQGYYDICAPVYKYLGLPEKENPQIECSITAETKTTKGRKKLDSGLPVDCGVTVDMLPKGTYYTPASEKRGDKFTLEQHPITKARISKITSSSKRISTLEKYQELMEMYQVAQEDAKNDL